MIFQVVLGVFLIKLKLFPIKLLYLTLAVIQELNILVMVVIAINLFQATGLFLQLLKTSQNFRLFNVFRSYRNRPVT